MSRPRIATWIGFTTILLTLAGMATSADAWAQEQGSESSLPNPGPENTDERKVLAYRFAPLGLPQPLRFGVELPSLVPRTRIISDLGVIYLPLPGKKNVKVYTLEGGLSYRPWNGSFFANILVGYRYFAFQGDFSTFKIDDVAVAKTAKAALHTLYIAPVVGYSFKVSQSMTLGFDVGYQIPFLGWGHLIAYGFNDGEDSNNSDTLYIDDGAAMRRIARLPIPQLTLFRMTWEL